MWKIKLTRQIITSSPWMGACYIKSTSVTCFICFFLRDSEFFCHINHNRLEPENGGTTAQWHSTLLCFPLVHLHETFGFHSSDASVCRTVRQQLKHKPSADSKDLQFCCRPAQHSFIPSRLCFECSVIWSQVASQIHFWQYAILPVRLTQNNSPQKAIST